MIKSLFCISIFAFAIGLIDTIYLFFFFFKNTLVKETDMKKNPKVCILIPARDESKVIEPLLKSIEKQTYSIDSKDVYVIIESETDPTVDIVKKHHMSYFVRQHLDLKRKGYALQECIEDLVKKNKYYDCYFIMDADNLMTPSFIEKMLKDYHEGYAVSTGYRSLKNKDNYFPVSAGLTFYMINDLRNKLAMMEHGNLLLSGAGYYITGKYIKEWGTYPFHSLTEDYESSLYFALNGISTHYNQNAIFYDEQPNDYATSLKQRSRWIKGYLTSWTKYRAPFKAKLKQNPVNPGTIKKLRAGIIPGLYLACGFLLFIFTCILNLLFHFSVKRLNIFFIIVGIAYAILFLFTLALL